MTDPVNTPPKNNFKSQLLIFLAIGLVLLALYASGTAIFASLSDPAFARGLITFLICIATIFLAFWMVTQAFTDESGSDDKFRRAREIFAAMLGILGTIVGFYFGSATFNKQAPQIATLQISEKEVMSYISGGTRPYRVNLNIKGEYSGGNKLQISEPLVSEDGWVRFNKFEKPIAKAAVELTATDAQNIAAPPVKENFNQKEEKPDSTIKQKDENTDSAVKQ